MTHCWESKSAGGSKKNITLEWLYFFLLCSILLFHLLTLGIVALFSFFCFTILINYNTSVILPNIFYCYWNKLILIWNLSENGLSLRYKNIRKPFELFITTLHVWLNLKTRIRWTHFVSINENSSKYKFSF